MGMFVHFKFTVLELLLLCRANWVTIDGTLYKKPCAVLVKVDAELELPLFGQRIRCLFTSTLKFSTLHILIVTFTVMLCSQLATLPLTQYGRTASKMLATALLLAPCVWFLYLLLYLCFVLLFQVQPYNRKYRSIGHRVWSCH